MEDFVMAPTASDLWLDETAQTTLGGVFDAANEFIEEAAHFLVVWWRYAEKWSSSSFPPPVKAWRPASALGETFGGAAPASDKFQSDQGAGYPTLGERLAVAEELRTSGRLPGAKR
jgi:hypothetical protein